MIMENNEQLNPDNLKNSLQQDTTRTEESIKRRLVQEGLDPEVSENVHNLTVEDKPTAGPLNS